MRKKGTKPPRDAPPPQPHRVRLPGFLIEEEIGLGDRSNESRMRWASSRAAAARSAPRRSIGGCASHDSALTTPAEPVRSGTTARRSQSASLTSMGEANRDGPPGSEGVRGDRINRRG